jgi:hypothetical protein
LFLLGRKSIKGGGMTSRQWRFTLAGLLLAALGLVYYQNPDLAKIVAIILLFVIVTAMVMVRLAEWAWMPRNPEGG